MNLYQLFFPIAFLACTVSIESTHIVHAETIADETAKNLFNQFLSEIPEYQFPINMSCDYIRPSKNLALNKYAKYFPEGGRVVAKLDAENDFALIIFDFACDYSCPTLYSYNRNGVRIDSLNLTPGQCGEDERMKSKEWFSIDENIRINLTDTTEYYSFKDSKRNLDSITIEKKEYTFSGQGKFELLDAKTTLHGTEKNVNSN